MCLKKNLQYITAIVRKFIAFNRFDLIITKSSSEYRYIRNALVRVVIYFPLEGNDHQKDPSYCRRVGA